MSDLINTTSLKKLGLPHFAHLRAVAEGVAPLPSAERYLGVDTRHAALQMHRAVVDRARALGRRAGQGAWRLIGTSIGALGVEGTLPGTQPSLDEWAEARGYTGWRHADLLDLYNDAFPPNRKAARNARLRTQVLALLKVLEQVHAVPASPADRIDDWFTSAMASRMQAAGLLLLSELQALIGRGGRWWRTIPSIGRGKADRIGRYVDSLLPARAVAPVPWSGLDPGKGVSAVVLNGTVLEGADASASNRGSGTMVRAVTDAEIIETWISVRAVSDLTARCYRREARRLYLWATVERGKGLSSLNAEDCAAYVAFLADLPECWIGKPAPLADRRWTPFAKQLSAASRRQTHIILKSFFDWMQRASYLKENPWELVGLKVGDDAQDAEALMTTRAFTPEAWEAIASYLNAPTEDAAHLRARFIYQFIEATGLRSRELLDATLGQLRYEPGHWYLLVIGKGNKARPVALTQRALAVLNAYLASRGLPAFDDCASDLIYAQTRLVVNLQDGESALGYQAFYETMKRVLKHAIDESGLPQMERRRALAASPHWLRHTFGTRAVERGVSTSVLMRQFGHADERPTARYTRALMKRVSEELEKGAS